MFFSGPQGWPLRKRGKMGAKWGNSDFGAALPSPTLYHSAQLRVVALGARDPLDAGNTSAATCNRNSRFHNPRPRESRRAEVHSKQATLAIF
jgi:hypothetical protein